MDSLKFTSIFFCILLVTLLGCRDTTIPADDCALLSTYRLADSLTFELYSIDDDIYQKRYYVESSNPIRINVQSEGFVSESYSLIDIDVCKSSSNGEDLTWDEQVLFLGVLPEPSQPMTPDCYRDIYSEGSVTMDSRICTLSFIENGEYIEWQRTVAQEFQFAERIVAYQLLINGSLKYAFKLTDYY